MLCQDKRLRSPGLSPGTKPFHSTLPSANRVLPKYQLLSHVVFWISLANFIFCFVLFFPFLYLHVL